MTHKCQECGNEGKLTEITEEETDKTTVDLMTEGQTCTECGTTGELEAI